MNDNAPVITALTAADGPSHGIDRVYAHATVHTATDDDSLAEYLPETDILLVTDFRTDALAENWHLAKRLKWIHATSAGVDQLLFDELRNSEVVVTNARGFFDRSISEYVLGAILAFAKDTRGNIAYQSRHEWNHRDTETIAHQRVLVVGAGSIGHEIGSICRAVGMMASGVARTARDGDDVFDRIHATDTLLEHLPDADFVVIAAPLTESTHHLFGDKAFDAMKPGARLINVGRGPVVDTDALLRALDAKQIAGAALDVYEEEPLPPDHPLWAHDNVLMSAHMSGDFIGWREALIDQFLDNFARWQQGAALHNVVKK